MSGGWEFYSPNFPPTQTAKQQTLDNPNKRRDQQQDQKEDKNKKTKTKLNKIQQQQNSIFTKQKNCTRHRIREFKKHRCVKLLESRVLSLIVFTVFYSFICLRDIDENYRWKSRKMIRFQSAENGLQNHPWILSIKRRVFGV